jgi:HAE1 family hydrophobic/amphiphilic exporter-1
MSEDLKTNGVGSSDQRYLDSLTFNPELRKSWLNFFVSNFRVVILLIVLLTAGGIYAFLKLPRESNPEVKIPIAVVTTVYPGASPADVEEFVTKKLETAISGIKGLKKVTSNSSNSFSAITVEFDAKQDLDSSIRSLRDKVTFAKNEISTDAKDPVVTEISLDDQPILTITLTGPYDGFAMRGYGEDLKDELEKIPGVREVNISGGDEREFKVAYDPQSLIFYGISADQANQAIVASNIAIPAGNFDGEKFVYPVRSDARVYDAAAIGAIPVSHTPDGSIVAIKDLGTVEDTSIKKTVLSRFSVQGARPDNAITLSIIKRTGSSVLDTVDAARSTAQRIVSSFPKGVRYDTSRDMAELVRKDFDRLTHDFILTFLLVFGVLFLVVGLKEAFVAGLAIPLVFFATFGALLMEGISLNFLSLFSLILALGLLVDDAIVVVSATKQYLRSGKFTPEEAVLLVLNDFKVVLTTTTLTTVWAFLPLLFSTGIIGEYIKSIPITVSITLLSSLFIALMINHPLAAVLERIRLTRKMFILLEALLVAVMGALFIYGGLWGFIFGTVALAAAIWMIRWYEKGGRESMAVNEELVEKEWEDENLIKKKLREQGDHENGSFGDRLIHGILHFDRLLPIYEKYLRVIISTRKSRFITIGVTFALFLVAVSMPVTGIVKSEFFPLSDGDNIYIDLRVPVGTRLEETNKSVEKIEEKLLAYKDIQNFSTIVGRPSPMSNSSRTVSNIASVTVTLKDAKLRSLKSYDIADKMRADLGSLHDGVITVSTPAGGPPSGSAFEARIAGDDLGQLDIVAHDLEPRLASIPGVINTDISLKDSAPEYTFALNQSALEQNSLNAAYVGSALRMAISGSEISTVIENNKEVKILASFDEKKIPDLQSLQNLAILNMRKQPVFLKDVATIELRPSVDSITRINQKRTVLLSAGATAKTNSNEILAAFQSKLKDYKMPAGYAIIYGGQNEQNAESVLSVIRAMAIAMILIVSTLIIQFNSFKKALIVLVTIPLALIGVFLGMALFDVHLSFPGLIGVLALFGIVVKNAIILVDKMNLNINSGIPFFESVVDAGKSRMEAIFITSICTIFGILPITLSNEMWRSLGGAVIFGLSLSSFLTLFLVPTLFLTFIGEKERF